ncbi:MAG TPA: PAS domain S-box protein, partial [Polyangiaceae bacterium]
ASRSTFARFLEETFASKESRTCDVELAREGRAPLAVTIDARVSSEGRECRAVVIDLTERKRVEEDALYASEARFGLLVDAVKDHAIFLLDPEGRVVTWNAGARALKGYAADEVIGRHFSLFYSIEDRDRGKPEHELMVAAAEGRFDDEAWRVRKDGSRLWANVVITAVRDAKGKLVNFAKITRDLSEPRAAAKRRLELLVRSAPDGVIVVDREGRIVQANPRAAKLFGYTGAELLALSQDELVPERLRIQHRSHRARYADAPSVRLMGTPALDVVGLRKDGTEFPTEIGLSPLQTPEGTLVVAFIRDLTAQRHLREQRVRTADRLTRLQSITAALAEALGADDVAAFILSTAFEVVGAHAGLVARTVEDGRELEIVREGRNKYASKFGSSTQVGAGRLRFSIDVHAPLSDAMRSGSAVWLQSPAEIRALYPADAPVFEEAGQRAVVCLPLVSRDAIIGGLRLSFSEERTFDAEDRAFLATFASQCALALDRAELYEEAVAARDLAEHASMMRDEFLAIVAHDLGNPLNIIGLWARLLSGDAPSGAQGDKEREGTGKIVATVGTMAALVHDLGDVAAMDAGRLRIQKKDQDVKTLVAQTVDVMAPLCLEKKISLTGKAPALPLPCDPGRVQQVLGNLIGNALKFTPEGGTITVEAVPSVGEMRFCVVDNGPGIAEEARAHVFERYWRGKGSDLSRGLGLGLFISRKIVEAHGGKIWVESADGGGSRFCFTIPLA